MECLHTTSLKALYGFNSHLYRRFSVQSSAGRGRASLRGGWVSESGECHEDISYNPASGHAGDTVRGHSASVVSQIIQFQCNAMF